MPDDFDLLADYAATGNPSSFDLLVRRHADWVYAAARRRTGSADLADDVTQATFVVLARKAKTIGRRESLAAWLFRVVRYVSVDAVRQRSTRTRHERRAARPEAVMVETRQDDDSPDGIAQHIDAALDRLPSRDRETVILYFFNKHTLQQIGDAQRVAASTVQRRLEKSLSRLGLELRRRGVTAASTATLSATLAAVSHLAAPPSATAGITGLIAAGKTATAGPAGLANGAAKTLSLLKAKQLALATAALATALGAGGIAWRGLSDGARPVLSATTVPAGGTTTGPAPTPVVPPATGGAGAADSQTRLHRIAITALADGGNPAFKSIPASFYDAATWSTGPKPAAEWSPAVRQFVLNRFRALAHDDASRPEERARLIQWLAAYDPLAGSRLGLTLHGHYSVGDDRSETGVDFSLPDGEGVEPLALERWLNGLTPQQRSTLLYAHRRLPMNQLTPAQRALAGGLVRSGPKAEPDDAASDADAGVRISFGLTLRVWRTADGSTALGGPTYEADLPGRAAMADAPQPQ